MNDGKALIDELMNPLDSVPPPDVSDNAKRWIADNAGGIQAWNDWIEQNGMPLDDLRRG